MLKVVLLKVMGLHAKAIKEPVLMGANILSPSTTAVDALDPKFYRRKFTKL